MIVVGIDTETTGTSFYTDDEGNDNVAPEVVEVGWCVYDLVSQIALAGGYDIFKTEHWSKEAEAVHQIPKHLTRSHGHNPATFDLWSRVAQYKPQAVVAHNAEFDHRFIEPHWKEFCQIPWICSMDDLPHGNVIKWYNPLRFPKKMKLLAVEYGIRFDYDELHRAYTDAVVSCQILARHREFIPQLLENKASHLYRDVVVGGPYLDAFKKRGGHDIFMQYGFRWERDIDKNWHKKQVVDEELARWMEHNCPNQWKPSVSFDPLCGTCAMRPVA